MEGTIVKILIVEDDQETRAIMAILLKQKGFDPVEARDGAEALEIFKNEDIDAVILDIVMPGMDGFTTAKALRRTNPALPLIAVTACDRNEKKIREEDAFSSLDMTYIQKPFDIKQLVDTVRVKLYH